MPKYIFKTFFFLIFLIPFPSTPPLTSSGYVTTASDLTEVLGRETQTFFFASGTNDFPVAFQLKYSIRGFSVTVGSISYFHVSFLTSEFVPLQCRLAIVVNNSKLGLKCECFIEV